MSWSAGVFTRTNGVYNGASVWNSDKGAGVKIVTSRHDYHDEDIATGINTCLTKDGTNTATANLPMGGFRHTGVGAALALDQYLTHAQATSGVEYYGATGGTSTDYTVTPSIPVSPTDGTRVSITFHTTNAIAPTLDVNGAAYYIKSANGQKLPANVLITGVIYTLQLTLGVAWTIVSPSESGWITWVPSYGGTGAMTFGTVTTDYARWNYDYVSSALKLKIAASGTTAGVASPEITFTMPLTMNATGYVGNGLTTDVTTFPSFCYVGSTTQVYVRKYDSSNYALAAGKAFTQNIEIPYFAA